MKLKLPFRLFPEKSGSYQWIWMINLILPIYFLSTKPFHESWIGFAAVFIMIAAYYRIMWNVGRPQLIVFISLQVAAVGVLSGIYASPFLYFEFFAAVGIGMLNSTRLIIICSSFQTAMSICVLRLHYLHNGDDFWISFLPSMIILFFFPFMIRAQRRARDLSRQLQVANDEIARLSKNEERQRIARDLHDTIGHTLTLITLKSELVEKMIPRKPELAVQEAQEIHRTARTALKQLRELISDMQSVDLEEELVQAGRMLESAGIRLHIQGTVGRAAQRLDPPPVVRNILGMCLRECVTNIVKHSKAQQCAISLGENAGSYVLNVTDDGIGISSEGSRIGQSGNGVLGMKERLSLLEGKLEFTCPDGGGTAIRVTIPKVLKQQAAEVIS